MHTNRLIHEKSPYLLQHAHNPVDWYAWGPEAFQKAREEDKPIFLSAGYSTCHWCHVMERESFENEAIAAQINRDFVAVKLDREERPDIDRIYMLFVQATTGSGGWPMSVWMTPDLKPFYGGTYFPPDNRYGRPGFGYVLQQLAQAWKEQREKLVDSSIKILGELESHSQVHAGGVNIERGAFDSCYHYFRRTFDSHHGGFGQAPKFPRPSVLDFLFRYSVTAKEEEAREMALTTLREMAKGGMHDHLGGGFHRYSVDERWFVPHFEKMLYDQAQLAISYLEAYQITKEEPFAEVARGIFEYVLRDMTHPQGGFFSAEDADSVIDPAHPHEKGEGAFYVWTVEELKTLLGADRALAFAQTYGCREKGNVDSDPHAEFTGKNILYLDSEFPAAGFDAERRTLLAARAQRTRPHLDDKVLASWNGLMISAFAKGAQVLNEPRYLEAALRAIGFVRQELFLDGKLMRRWRDGEAAVEGFLDDYAALAQACVDAYEATFDQEHLAFGRTLAVSMLELFEDKTSGGFYSTSGDSDELVLRLKEDYDGAEPAGNSVAAGALLRLAEYCELEPLREAADDTLAAFASRINQQGVTIPRMLCAVLESLQPKSEVRFTGDAQPLINEFRRHFRPFTTVRWDRSGEPSAMVCEDFVCQPPVSAASDLRQLLR
ncbi:thioredoxin domain-containing protein [uncultured Paludibaculum sp.]|uniref:thioredoxin domain-containing protein n=1 Tax=uncultured Paludibaculum sp. TaxID=1765020 RepID=UPI002AAC476C|nr:thioredoxin domain-containing protein [uncultured Paludibaculum sp.]